MDDKLGGLLRDIVELFTEIPALPANEKYYWEKIEILRQRVKEAYPA
jgi:hypothetical protein